MFFSGIFKDGFLLFPWGGEKSYLKWHSGNWETTGSSGKSFSGLVDMEKRGDSGTKGPRCIYTVIVKNFFPLQIYTKVNLNFSKLHGAAIAYNKLLMSPKKSD